MCGENDGGSFGAKYSIFPEDLLCHGTQGAGVKSVCDVVENGFFLLGVQGSGNGLRFVSVAHCTLHSLHAGLEFQDSTHNPLSLSATESLSFTADHRGVTFGHTTQIKVELAATNYVFVPRGIQFRLADDIVANRAIVDPGRLAAICYVS